MGYKLYQADTSDIDFIYREIIAGARKGQFDPRLLATRQKEFLYDNLRSMVIKGRRKDKRLPAQVMILEKEKIRIAFAIMSQMFQKDGGNEIYAFGVAENYRGKGHGKYLLGKIMERWSMVDIYARCYPASTEMYALLLKQGFEFITNLESGSRLVRYPSSPHLHIPPSSHLPQAHDPA